MKDIQLVSPNIICASDSILANSDLSIGLWAPNSTIRMLAPAEVLGAGTSEDDFRERFKQADLIKPIVREMAMEDSTLRNYIDNCRLEHWVKSAQEWALKKLEQDRELQEAQMAEANEMMELLETEDNDLKTNKERVTGAAHISGVAA